MDLGRTRELERELDRLMLSTNPEVIALCGKAQTAYKLRKWRAFEEAVMEAKEVEDKKIILHKFMTRRNITSTKVMAKRYVTQGKVFVDGKVATSMGLDISDAKEVQIGRRTYKVK